MLGSIYINAEYFKADFTDVGKFSCSIEFEYLSDQLGRLDR